MKSCDCFTTDLKPATEEQTTKEGAFNAIEHLSATEVPEISRPQPVTPNPSKFMKTRNFQLGFLNKTSKIS